MENIANSDSILTLIVEFFFEKMRSLSLEVRDKGLKSLCFAMSMMMATYLIE